MRKAGFKKEIPVPASTAPNPSPSGERQPTFHKNADGVLVVAMTNYSDFQDFVGTTEKLDKRSCAALLYDGYR